LCHPATGRAALARSTGETYVRGMAKRGTSFGMVVLVVTMAIVLLLVAKRWQQLAPSARETSLPGRPSAAAASPGAPGDPIPGLREVEVSTNAHAEDVGEALAASEP
jgi:hypothetical protein